MCALRETDKLQFHLVAETVEETVTAIEEKPAVPAREPGGFQPFRVTAYYWCRVCKQKTPAAMAKSCDCGVTMCNKCWEEWDLICPICESDMSPTGKNSP